MKGLDVVGKTDPGGVAGRQKVAEGQVKSLQERIDKADAEGRQGGQQKQGEAALDWPAQQPAVDRIPVCDSFDFFLFHGVSHLSLIQDWRWFGRSEGDYSAKD